VLFGVDQSFLLHWGIGMSASEHPWFRNYPVHRRNIIWHWNQATDDETRRGLQWYADAHRIATAIADGDAHLGAGILAVYSPQQAWVANLLLAAQVLRTWGGIGGAGSGAFASTAQKVAADRLLAGERYEQVLAGPKVLAFAHLIEHGGDGSPEQSHVVVDRHALSVAHGTALTVAQYNTAPMRTVQRRGGATRHRHYDYVVALYQQAATEISPQCSQPVTAYQVQAVTWLVRRRLTQAAQREHGMSALDKGREQAQINTDVAWRRFVATHLPQLADEPQPGAGHTRAA
jgi:hypothetical protein